MASIIFEEAPFNCFSMASFTSPSSLPSPRPCLCFFLLGLVCLLDGCGLFLVSSESRSCSSGMGV